MYFGDLPHPAIVNLLAVNPFKDTTMPAIQCARLKK